jgi:cell division protein FtsB
LEVDADTLGPRVAICKAYLDGAVGTARMLYGGQWAESPEDVQRAIVGAALSYGRFCRERVHEACGRQATACQDLRFTNEDLRAANDNLRAANDNLRAANDNLRAANDNLRAANEKLRGQVSVLQNSRAVRAAEWLSSHRLLARVLRTTFDAVSGLRRHVLRLLGLRREAEPKPPAPADGAAIAQSAAAPRSKESEGGGPNEGEGDA